MLVGAEVKNLSFAVASPKDIWTVLTQYLASTVGLPATELFGHTVSERASNNDESKSNLAAKTVRENILTPRMIIPFFDKLIKLGILTPPTDRICVKWNDLSEPSETDKAELILKKMQANTEAVNSGTDRPFPDINEVRLSAGYEEIEKEERFSE